MLDLDIRVLWRGGLRDGAPRVVMWSHGDRIESALTVEMTDGSSITISYVEDNQRSSSA